MSDDNGYPQWMAQCVKHADEHRGGECPDCGGSGIVGLRCCGGFECGCRGMPIDFVACQKACGNPAPEWFDLPQPEGDR